MGVEGWVRICLPAVCRAERARAVAVGGFSAVPHRTVPIGHLLGAWFGAIVDRYDRKRLLMLAGAGLGLVALGYAVASATDSLSLQAIYLLAMVWGVINALDTPARRALVPMLVPRAVAAGASGMTSTVLLLGMTVGSALGAVLVASAGPAVTFAVNAASFLVDVLLLWTIRVGPSPRVARAPGQIRDGLRYVWRAPELRAPLLALAIVATLSFSVQISVPIFVRESLEGGAALVGLAFTAVTTGALAGALTSVWLGERVTGVAARATLGMALALGVTALSPEPVIALVGLLGVGFAWSMLLASVMATFQGAEPAMIGRAMALLGVVLLGGLAVGGPLAAVVIDLAGARLDLALGAASAVAAAWLTHRRLRVPAAVM
jgi:MFS family permease